MTHDHKLGNPESTRRTFLSMGGLASTGLVLGVPSTEATADQDATDAHLEETQLNLADVTFLQLMAYHHRAALEIAELAQERTDREELLDLAQLEIDHQQQEIDEMKGILSEAGIDPGRVLGVDLDDVRTMVTAIPGNPKPNELADLRSRAGEAFDLRFIELFTYHHSGAIQLSQQVIHEGQSQEVTELAEEIIEMQRGMILEMYRWYIEWVAETTPKEDELLSGLDHSSQ